MRARNGALHGTDHEVLDRVKGLTDREQQADGDDSVDKAAALLRAEAITAPGTAPTATTETIANPTGRMALRRVQAAAAPSAGDGPGAGPQAQVNRRVQPMLGRDVE